jgi:hypothetical protein
MAKITIVQAEAELKSAEKAYEELIDHKNRTGDLAKKHRKKQIEALAKKRECRNILDSIKKGKVVPNKTNS